MVYISINIGNGASSTSIINIGSGSATINLNGTAVSANSISLIPQSASTALNYAFSDNLSQNFFLNQTSATNSRIGTLPVNPYAGQKITIVNRSTTNTNTIQVGNTLTQTINGYGLVGVTSFTLYTGQAVILQWVDTLRNYWMVQYKSNEIYQPIVPNYSSLVAFTDLTQIGYTYTQSVVQSPTTANGTTTYSMLITASPFPVGLYNVNVRNTVTVGVSANSLSLFTSSLSTTTTSGGAILGLINSRYPSNLTFPALFIDQSCATGPYTRSAVESVYVTLSITTNTWVTPGVIPTLSCSITRIA